jgi:hypothetical protein
MSAIALISTLASISSSPITLLSMIPLLAVGLNYYRYANVDPESAPIDAPVVSCSLGRALSKLHKRDDSLYISNFLLTHLPLSLSASVSVKEAL